MLFNLVRPYADHFFLFNLLRYTTFRAGAACMTAMLVSFVFGPMLIRWLRSMQRNGQPIREDGPERLVRGVEGLERGVELGSDKAQLGRRLELAHGHRALVRVDAGEADEHLRVVLDRLCDEFVGEAWPVGGGLRVPCQEDGLQVEAGVFAGETIDRVPGNLGAEVALGGLDVALKAHVQPLRGGQVDVEIDRPHLLG